MIDMVLMSSDQKDFSPRTGICDTLGLKMAQHYRDRHFPQLSKILLRKSTTWFNHDFDYTYTQNKCLSP